MDKHISAYFGGGCFWCLEAVFQRLKGVSEVVSGFADGKVKNPSYREVCSGLTGHNEVVKITYDPAQIGFKDLLNVFFAVHDPTTLNRQGNDVGTQYRSGIYYVDELQKKAAEDYIANEASEVWDDRIVTEVKPLTEFYPADEYHKDYFNNNPEQGYCRFIIGPKVEKLKSKFQKFLKNG
jgi:peptide-methionine (S)-S-oxide reductase